MIEILLKVIDRLIAIKGGRIQNRKEMLNQIFEPVFNELLLVHGDYIKMFTDTLCLLPMYESKRWSDSKITDEEYRKKIEAVKTSLENRRIEFEPVRTKVQVFAESLHQLELKGEERGFVNAVIEYFPAFSSAVSNDTSGTMLVATLESVAALEIRPHYLQYEVDRVIAKTIEEHKLKWSDVCERFAKLKIEISRDH